MRTEDVYLSSESLQREVKISFFMPAACQPGDPLSLLLINDGQDMEKMHFSSILDKLYTASSIEPLLFAAIHAGKTGKWNMAPKWFLITKNGGRGHRCIRPLYLMN